MNYLLYFLKSFKFLTKKKPLDDLLTRNHGAALSSCRALVIVSPFQAKASPSA